MPRNLERRVELMTPVFEKNLADKLFGIIRLQSEDNSQAHELQSNGEYKKLSPIDGKKINSQKILEDYTNATYTSLKREEEEVKAKKLARRMFRES